MRRLGLALILGACTSTEARELPSSPPASANAPAPIEAPPETRPTTSSEGASAEIDAPRPTASSEPKCAEATTLWAAGADAMSSGNAETARKHWLRLVQEHPLCPAVSHAFLGFAEHFFAQGDFASAKQSYEMAARSSEIEVQVFARYKIAWCQLDLGDADGALAAFLAAIRAAGDGRAAPRLQRLRDVALRDSVTAFVEVSQPSKAAAFYQAIAGDRVRTVLEVVVQRYRDRGDMAAAALVREQLLALPAP